MDKPWKVIFAFVGVFMAGAIFGGLFTMRASGKRLAPEPGRPDMVVEGKAPNRPPGIPPAPGTQPRPPVNPNTGMGRIAPALMRSFTQRLNPTAEQRERIRPLVNRAAEDLNRLQREHFQDTGRVSERLYTDVSAVLTVEQRTKLEKMREETQERVRREREKRGDTTADATRPGPNPVGRPKEPGVRLP